ncbi:MAG: hypothetical protein Q8P83_00955 [bacterium]|nr:hypothetical protein [bacterium]
MPGDFSGPLVLVPGRAVALVVPVRVVDLSGIGIDAGGAAALAAGAFLAATGLGARVAVEPTHDSITSLRFGLVKTYHKI